MHSGLVATATNLALMVWKFAGNVILARLLLPRDFGISNICFFVMTAVVLLSDAGLDTAVVRSPRGEDPRFLNVVWTLGIVRSLIMFAMTLLFTWPVARFYHEPALLTMLPVLGLSIPIECARSTYLELCDRRLTLRPRMMLELRGQILTTVVQLAFACVWPSAWAIIVGQLTSSTYRLIESHRLSDAAPNRLAWDKAYADEIFQFGKWIFVSTALTFVAGQGDRALIGHVISLEMLGVYGIAATIASIPQQIHSVIAHRIIFPLVSEYVRERPAELGGRLREARTVVLAAMLLAVTGVVAGAGPFFELIYKDEYREAGVLAPALAWVLWVSILQNSVDRLPIAHGDSRLLALISLVSLVAKATGGLLGFRLAGLPGFLLGLFAGSLVEYSVAHAIAIQRYGVRLLSQDAKYTAALAVISGIVWSVRSFGLLVRVGVGATLVLAVLAFVVREYTHRARSTAA